VEERGGAEVQEIPREDRLKYLADYAESFTDIAKKIQSDLERLEKEGQEKSLEVLRHVATAVYLGVKAFVEEAEAMQPRQGDVEVEHKALRRVQEAVDELFDIARVRVPAVLNKVASDKVDASVTELDAFRGRRAG
jgi:transcriptional regulator with XRE-family HTH domain